MSQFAANEPMALLIGRYDDGRQTYRATSRSKVLDVPDHMRESMDVLSQIPTLRHLRSVLEADGAPVDDVIDHLSRKGRLRVLDPASPLDMIEALGDLHVATSGWLFPNATDDEDTVVVAENEAAETGWAVHQLVGAALFESLRRENLRTVLVRMNEGALDAETARDVLDGLGDVCKAGIAWMEKVG